MSKELLEEELYILLRKFIEINDIKKTSTSTDNRDMDGKTYEKHRRKKKIDGNL
jgi:hypothetical protein